MNVGLHHSCVDPHLSPCHNAFLLRQFDQSAMQVRDHFASDCLSDARQRFGVRYLAQSNPAEIPVRKIRPHLPLQGVVAPVANMLEQQ